MPLHPPPPQSSGSSMLMAGACRASEQWKWTTELLGDRAETRRRDEHSETNRSRRRILNRRRYAAAGLAGWPELAVGPVSGVRSGGVDGEELLVALNMLGLAGRADPATVDLLLGEFGAAGCASLAALAACRCFAPACRTQQTRVRP